MEIGELSSQEQAALLLILQYWAQHWDFECPTLFGLEQEELQSVAELWPGCLAQNEQVAVQALNGGLREFLYGASAVGPEVVQSVTGIKREEVIALYESIWPRIKAVLG